MSPSDSATARALNPIPAPDGVDAPGAPAVDKGKGTLASSVVDRLRKEVLSGELLPGQSLRLDELRERYGVSLSPLREAVSRLGAEGLLLAKDKRGVRVAPVSVDNLAEVVRLRCVLEPMALKDAIAHADEDWEVRVTTALTMLTRQEQQANPHMRVERWERLHRQLHMSLLSTCRMPLLLQFCTLLNDRADRYRRLFLANQQVDASVSLEHQHIVDASLRQDVELATSLLSAHIERSAGYVRAAIERQFGE